MNCDYLDFLLLFLYNLFRGSEDSIDLFKPAVDTVQAAHCPLSAPCAQPVYIRFSYAPLCHVSIQPSNQPISERFGVGSTQVVVSYSQQLFSLSVAACSGVCRLVIRQRALHPAYTFVGVDLSFCHCVFR